MRKHRLSDADVTAILNGDVQNAREDLRILANAVEAIRYAYSGSENRPSAELAARLDLDRDRLAVPAGDLPTRTTTLTSAAAPAATRSARGKAKMFLSWLAGLGLAAKIGIGATTAAAVGIGAGATGILPSPAQEVFVQVVGSAIPQQDEQPVTTDELEGDDVSKDSQSDHGDAVSEVAQNRENYSSGQEHAEAVKEVASVQGEEASTENRPDEAPPTEVPTDSPEQATDNQTDLPEQAEQRP